MTKRNLRAEFSAVLRKYGHSIIFVHQDKRFRCKCYSERSGEGRSDCGTCFGTTYRVSVEKRLTRRKVNTVPETLPGVKKVMPAGHSDSLAYVYYLEYDVEPKEGDLILEVEWQDNVPARIKEKLVVSVAEPMRLVEGRVEFYQVYVRTEAKGANDHAALTQH